MYKEEKPFTRCVMRREHVTNVIWGGNALTFLTIIIIYHIYNCRCVWRFIIRYLMNSELGTLEWINFNPDFLIRISTVETFHFCPNPLIFSLQLDIRKLFSPMRIFLFSHWLPAFLWLAATVSQMIKYWFEFYRFSYTFKIILQDYVNLEIKKKSGLSLNPDIHHSKIPSSCFSFSWLTHILLMTSNWEI